MISHTYQKVALIGFLGLIVISLTACGPRILVSTGTTLGLKATPGDGYTQPPQVTFGYKRAEVAFVPTKVQTASSSPSKEGAEIEGTDAFSVLAAIHFDTTWFGDTNLQSFVGTGIAARDVQGSDFQQAFAAATLGTVPASIQSRRVDLNKQRRNLDETQAQRILDLAGYSKVVDKNARLSLQDYILDATTEPRLMRLEAAFNRLNTGS